MQRGNATATLLTLALASATLGAACNDGQPGSNGVFEAAGDIEPDTNRLRALTFDTDSFTLDSGGARIPRSLPFGRTPVPFGGASPDRTEDGNDDERWEDDDDREARRDGRERGRGKGKAKGRKGKGRGRG